MRWVCLTPPFNNLPVVRADTSIDEQFRGFVLEELSALKNGGGARVSGKAAPLTFPPVCGIRVGAVRPNPRTVGRRGGAG